MLLKSLIFYKLDEHFTLENLQNLKSNKFEPCSTLQAYSIGWVSPYEDDRLVCKVQKQGLLRVAIESKKVPGSWIKTVLQERVAEIVAKGGKVSRKDKKDLKAEIEVELLAKVMPRQERYWIWFDFEHKLMALAVGSIKKSDEILSLVSNSFKSQVAYILEYPKLSSELMEQWLLAGEPEGDLFFGTQCELKARDEAGACVKYSNHVLDTEDVKNHIREGKHPVSATFVLDECISFMLTDQLVFKKLKTLQANEAKADAEDKATALEAELLFEADACHTMLTAITEHLIEKES